MKLWQGRFEGSSNELANIFNSSLSFDTRLATYDIKGSIAHVKMLKKQGIIDASDANEALNALSELLAEINDGSYAIEGDYEDIHMAVEEILTQRIGDAAKRIHTARSRNDQVALDMKLFAKEAIYELTGSLEALIAAFRSKAYSHLDDLMPGYTHMQKAQPITLAHHLSSYIEMLLRDRSRLQDCLQRMDTMPLGSGALAASTFDIDRHFLADELGFREPSANSLDSVSDRDYLLELLFCLSALMMHLSRFSEELIIWSSEEYAYVSISDAFSTGSSMMPQKKNPDILELIRGKAGRVYGSLITLLTVMKGLPLAYNKDMQEDKQTVFDAIDTALACMQILAVLLEECTFNTAKMLKSVQESFCSATDLAEYLVKKGCPFRDAHFIVGSLVKKCIAENKWLSELSLTELKEQSRLFEQDAYQSLDPKTSVYTKSAYGSPNPDIVRQYLDNIMLYQADSNKN
ncbi:MAG: argininosuccinate lyase [Eubacteriaceae bacterium]|nr:argininosuccinate lyase [Eubacteriaceae bacterium]